MHLVAASTHDFASRRIEPARTYCTYDTRAAYSEALSTWTDVGPDTAPSAGVMDLRSLAILELSTYTPNGARENLYVAPSPAPLEPMGFTGKESDEELGMTYFGERWLIPRLGRWASSDPLHVHASGGGEALNSYHYVSGNLLQARDPLGLSARIVGSTATQVRTAAGGTGQATVRTTDRSAIQMGTRDFRAQFAPAEARLFTVDQHTGDIRLARDFDARVSALGGGANLRELVATWVATVRSTDMFLVVPVPLLDQVDPDDQGGSWQVRAGSVDITTSVTTRDGRTLSTGIWLGRGRESLDFGGQTAVGSDVLDRACNLAGCDGRALSRGSIATTGRSGTHAILYVSGRRLSPAQQARSSSVLHHEAFEHALPASTRRRFTHGLSREVIPLLDGSMLEYYEPTETETPGDRQLMQEILARLMQGRRRR